MSSYIPSALRRGIFSRAEQLCEYCLLHEDDTYLGLQVEHIISEKHGGPTIESNLAAACVFCNRAKGTDIATLSPQTGKLCRLFNPREDKWREHFEQVGIKILGITDIDAATAKLPGFNDQDRLDERVSMVKAGRFRSSSARLLMRAIGPP